MSHKIYKDNQEYRMNMEKAKKQLEALTNDLSSDSNFDDIYVKDAYKDLRALAFHYEYIGYLVLRNRLNFDIAFDTITFPNWLIASREARKIMKYGREVTPDLWNGAEHLYLTYEVKRKYNKVKDIESLPEDSKKRKEEKARRKKALINARNEWKKHYRKLPK